MFAFNRIPSLSLIKAACTTAPPLHIALIDIHGLLQPINLIRCNVAFVENNRGHVGTNKSKLKAQTDIDYELFSFKRKAIDPMGGRRADK